MMKKAAENMPDLKPGNIIKVPNTGGTIQVGSGNRSWFCRYYDECLGYVIKLVGKNDLLWACTVCPKRFDKNALIEFDWARLKQEEKITLKVLEKIVEGMLLEKRLCIFDLFGLNKGLFLVNRPKKGLKKNKDNAKIGIIKNKSKNVKYEVIISGDPATIIEMGSISELEAINRAKKIQAAMAEKIILYMTNMGEKQIVLF